MSQRAHLLPTISRSLGRVANAKAISSSMQDRIAKPLDKPTLIDSISTSTTRPPNQISHHGVIWSPHVLLWQNAQSKLPIKAIRNLDAFCNMEKYFSSALNPDSPQDEDKMIEDSSAIGEFQPFPAGIDSEPEAGADSADTRCDVNEDKPEPGAAPIWAQASGKPETEMSQQEEEEEADLLLARRVDAGQDEPRSTLCSPIFYTIPRFQATKGDSLVESSSWPCGGYRGDSEASLLQQTGDEQEFSFEEDSTRLASNEDIAVISPWKLESVRRSTSIEDVNPDSGY